MAWNALGGDDRQHGGRSVAVLDDDDLASFTLCRAIEDAGCRCCRIGTPSELATRVAAGEIGIVVVDGDLAHGGCAKALDALRSIRPIRRPPVLVLMSDPQHERAVLFYRDGADMVLKKPLDLASIDVVVAACDPP